MLTNEQSDDLAGHLESCPDCQATITTLEDAEDTLIGRLRTPPGSESCLAEPQFQTALAQAIAGENGPVPFSPAVPFSLGEYHVLEELGRGGMGRVYKALHTKLDRVVAVKVLSRSRLEDRHAITRFEREMKAVGRLAHPNIVQAHDAREIDGTPVLIMEFVDGLDMAEIVHRIGPLPVADACELVRRTALALECAHEHGLVHRDIKPSNIMLTRSGEVKLLDLGLARFYAEAASGEEMTGTGQAMGTADYMAPEQASDSRTVDIRADIYSLGCTLYKLLTGQAPFGGPEYRGTLDKLNAHVHQPPPPISQFIANVPEDLSAIIDRLLAKNPADRFPAPAEVAKILEPFCTGANLTDIITRASSENHKAATVGLGSANDSPLSRRERARVRADQLPANIPTTAQPATAPFRRRPTVKTFLIGLAFFGAIAAAFWAGVLITIKRNGEIYQIEAPPSSRTTVDANGNPTVDLSNKPEAGKALAASYADDLKALEGEWKVVRLEKGRDKLSAAGINLGTHLRFHEPFLTIRKIEEGNTIHCGFRIDSAASPKTIDFFRLINGEFRKTDMLGIYKIDADRLTICFDYCPPPLKTQRPKSLEVEPGSSDVLLVLDRYQLSDDEKAIEGEWTAVSQIKDGKSISDGEMRVEYVRNIQTLSVLHDGRLMIRGGCVLNPAKEPKEITVNTDIAGYLLGIYHFEGDQLQIAYRYPIQTLGGDQRPKQFESLPSSGVTLLVLKKKEPQSAANPNPLETEPGNHQPSQNAKSTQSPADPNEKMAPAERSVTFRTAKITRGDITAMVSATGTIQPVEVVDVSAQVSGRIVSFGDDPRGATDPQFKGKPIDYNSPVEEGTVLARLDDAIAKLKVDQEKATVHRAQAEVAVAKAKSKSDEASTAAVDAAIASLAQSQAALEQAEINLNHTIIKSPVAGVIVARRKNIGQNVGPDPNAPSLFLIAKNMKNMYILASVDEADIGRIRDGMTASFTVDAFPNEKFTGKVIQIRKDAQRTQNAVAYTVVLAFDNSDLKLMPSMTANIRFEIDTRKDVFLVPNTALRWKPRPEMITTSGPAFVIRGDEKRVIIWIKAQDDKHVRPIEVQSGLTDGTMTEISGPDVKEGMEVVIGQSLKVGTDIGPTINPFSPEVTKQSAKAPASADENLPPPSPAQIQTTKDDKIDKDSFLSLLRDNVAKQSEVMQSGQCTYKSIAKIYRNGFGEKYNRDPLTINMQGKIYFDEMNFRLDIEIGYEPPSPDRGNIERHTILTKKWLAEKDSDIIRLFDSPGDFRADRFDPRVIAKAFIKDSEQLDIKKVTYEGRMCVRIEEFFPGAGVRYVLIHDPEKDFVLLRREAYYDNASRKESNKFRDDYPFKVHMFDYRKGESSGIWIPIKCLEQIFETIPLPEKRNPTLDNEITSEFDDYSFVKPPAKLFTLYNLSLLGVQRLLDNRKGPTTGSWYNLPSHRNLADTTYVPDPKGLPPDLMEEWIKDADEAR
jgi:RND family efflux transporter MFP subunit